MASKLLIDDYPIQVLPKLAIEIGLNEAIILQQIHYWLNQSNHNHDGKKWIYNTYDDWNKQFPFWSVMTIRRTITSLEKQNLILIANYNKAGFDKTRWYSINYPVVESVNRRCVQNEQTICSKRTDGSVQNEQTNTRDYTENTTENISMSDKSDAAPYKTIIEYLNNKVNKRFSYKSESNRKLIKARFNEGYKLEDFIKVIDIKTNEWINDEKMKSYLQPSTLFRGSNFDKYLNQELPELSNDETDNSFISELIGGSN
ncbi:conserved phage C-terminal domain-containing protein [Mammaliicoccus sp. R-M63]|uniref:conserved phage C-terminal domain-containing protein n=1 Tax=Mammaliicoccus sp. R-M63 TaxID=2898722 RepID=UPI001EFBBFC9|nr:conserved phage C-terminal domain-containing protein [Mammaliicoccus sp. R-M63]